MSSLARNLRLPTVTIFEDHISEWVEVVSSWIAQLVAKELKLSYDNIDDLSEEIASRIEELVAQEIDRIYDGFRYHLHVVVAEGDLTPGKKRCTVMDFLKFMDILFRKLYDESRIKVYEGEWEVVEEEDSEKAGLTKSWEKVSEEEELEDWEEGSFKTRFEETLISYVPAIFEEDIQEFVVVLSRVIVRGIIEKRVSEEDIPFYIKDEVSEKIYEIVEILEKLGSKYLNVIEGKFDTGTLNCRIVSVDEFIERLYRSTFRYTTYILDAWPSAPLHDYFDMEEFWSD
jgi:hypothetical protein